jgi:hypothetical protein
MPPQKKKPLPKAFSLRYLKEQAWPVVAKEPLVASEPGSFQNS